MSFFGTPAANSGGTNFNFGAQKPAIAAAAPLFGATTAPVFGGSAATATPTFGAAAPSTLPAFGAPTATVTPAFGTQSAATNPAFGALPAGPIPSFGASPAPAFGSNVTTMPAATVQPTSTLFGAGVGLLGAVGPTTTTTPAPAFGAVAVPQTATTSSATPALNFGYGGGTGPTTTSAFGATNTFSFSKPTAAVVATTTAASLNFATKTTAATGATLLPTISATSTFIGLGGVDVTTSQPKPGDTKQDIKVKETQLPDEIAKTVDALKNHIKAQKTISSDIGRTSTSKFTNVSNEIMTLQWALQEIANQVELNYNHIKLLRTETSRTMQSVEMAQRTQDTPAGLQYENNLPFQFFQNLIAKYEEDLNTFRQQIILTERHMHSLSNPQNIAPDDLKRGFNQINESFMSLAGRLYDIHQKVEEQKEVYLNLRKYRLHDSTNVFEHIDNPPPKKTEPSARISSGPTPFSNFSAMNSLGKSYSNTSNTACTASTVQPSK